MGIIEKIKKFIFDKYIQSIIRHLGPQVVAWLTVMGVSPELAQSFMDNGTAVAMVVGSYLIAQGLSLLEKKGK
jgi:hypothetical protein